MNRVSDVKSASVTNSPILGTYEGECADANITNKNGLDITREVWENVFNSDEYKDGIRNSWYIGFLGHPEDPGCQDFKDACIIMREGHIDDDGKIHGKFDLIDTPVGRIVKAFQDAGVVFGISVRGAGDIVDNSVDPETFVFRGFDLVAFPAYPNAVPKFQQIAASTDAKTAAQYKAICAAVDTNLDKIDSVSTLACIQSQFAKNSDQYAAIDEKKKALESCDEPAVDLTNERLEAMTQLYLEACVANRDLVKENDELKKQLSDVKASTQKKIKRIEAITTAQAAEYKEQLEAKANVSIKANKALKKQLIESDEQIDSYKSKIQANQQTIRSLRSRIEGLQEKIQTSEDENLKYNQKVQAAEDLVSSIKTKMSRVEADNRKTVAELSDAKKRASNLEEVMATNRKLEKLLAEYQSAYASLYAGAIGADLQSIQASSMTSVSEIQAIVARSGRINETTYDDSSDIEEISDEYEVGDVNDLVTA